MQKGRLKIFFGYSAGVGKTYAMLKAAQEMKKSGVDVVLGYLEPHDRPETFKMAEGLETLPLKEVIYKGITLKEFDVDGAIERRPQLILVDELAHTNAIGSKNRKRYLDVEELVNSGIDVWTTVNVQHIESLHDLVDSATSVDVNERIPDEIFDYADEVVLIDIEPETLIERMKEGKIYNKSRAAVALENFFKTDNLSSLRELFMRRSADRVEKHNNNGTLKMRILVLISPSPSSERTIRIAARMAEAYHCRFSAMYVERNGELSDEAAAQIKKNMRLVQDLDGETIVKYGEDVVETVADYVRLAGVTNLIIGKTWKSVGKKVGLEDKFIMRMPKIELLIVPDNQRVSYRRSPVRDFFSKLFTPQKLLRKYRTANKTLDVFSLLTQAAYANGDDAETAVSSVLARAFERSCCIFGRTCAVTPWANESADFWGDENEMAVAEWCRVNGKPAGKGTDTLRGAKAIYFPIEAKGRTSVVSFSCTESKMTVTDRMIFNQLKPVLKLIFSDAGVR
ncbi:MAG: hypothetical protein ACLSUT_03005 [Christensenellales bacterium]